MEYEATDEDHLFYTSLSTSKEFFEKCIDLFEKDTENSQIIPEERAVWVCKDKGLLPDGDSVKLCGQFYHYWRNRRENEKKPLLRRFWKSESTSDSNFKLVFQPRNWNRDRMRLRNARKNDSESFEKVWDM